MVGSDQVYRTTEWSADLRVGGEFLEIDAPRTLVQTWKADWDTGVTTLTYRLEPISEGTRLTLRHEGFAGRPDSCRAHTAGWEQVLAWLGGFVEGQSETA